MKMPRIIRKRRAVSPILAAILLIGLAVAAGAVLFIVVLPLISSPGGTLVVDSESLIFQDTDDSGIYDKVTVSVRNDGTTDGTITDLYVQTSSDDGTSWNDASSSVSVPITVVKGTSLVNKKFDFAPVADDFTQAGTASYRVVVTFKIGTDGEESTLYGPVETKSHNGFDITKISASAGYYTEYTIDGNLVDRGARDGSAVTTGANTVAVTITNNWDCAVLLDKDVGSWTSVVWFDGLYASTDSNYGTGGSGVGTIYGLAVPGNNFDQAWSCDRADYDTAAAQFWTSVLGQTGTIQNTDSTEGRTIKAGESVTIHFFSLGATYDCSETTYYLAVSFYDVELRWSDDVTLETGSL